MLNIFIIPVILFVCNCYTIYLYIFIPLYVIRVDSTTVQGVRKKKKRERAGKNHGILQSTYTMSAFGGSASFCIQGAAIQNHGKEIHGILLNV